MKVLAFDVATVTGCAFGVAGDKLPRLGGELWQGVR